MSLESMNRHREELLAEQARIAEELAIQERAIQAAKQARADEPPPGSKIVILATFPNSDDTYEYLALRTKNPRPHGANWYVTGQRGKLDWDGVLRLVERGTYVIYPFNLIIR